MAADSHPCISLILTIHNFKFLFLFSMCPTLHFSEDGLSFLLQIFLSLKFLTSPNSVFGTRQWDSLSAYLLILKLWITLHAPFVHSDRDPLRIASGSTPSSEWFPNSLMRLGQTIGMPTNANVSFKAGNRWLLLVGFICFQVALSLLSDQEFENFWVLNDFLYVEWGSHPQIFFSNKKTGLIPWIYYFIYIFI